MSSAKLVILAAAIAVISATAGCGGGDGGRAPSPTGGGSGTAYDFVPPILNSMRRYSETIVDNSNNTIDIGFSEETTAVNADGSYSVLSASSTGSATVVNGTNYAMPTESQNYDPMGQETTYDYTASGNIPVTCTFEPHGSGPDYPLMAGDMWMLTFTVTCGASSPVTYTQSGSVVDVESVTVPAGTYTAIKLHSTLTWTDAEGTTRTQTITNWRDVATSYSVKQSISVAYGGALPTNGYAVSRELLLQSTS
jgi:hypothetical protein